MTNQYNKYKKVTVDWVNEIPIHWHLKKLKFVLNFLNYKRIPLSGEDRAVMEKKEYDYYGASGVIDKVDGYLFDGDYILVGEDGANLLSRSTPLAFKASGKFWVNNHAHILEPIDGDLDFLTYLLEAIDYTNYVTGSAQPKLTINNLANIELPIPPKEEQNAIAHFLNRKAEDIDGLIHQKELLIRKLLATKQAIIIESITKGLNPNVPLKPSGIDWLGNVPKHWSIKKVKQLAQIVNGSTPDSNNDSYWEGDINWITPADISKVNGKIIFESVRKITKEGFDSCGTTIVPIGSVILTTRAPIGNVAIAGLELCTNQGCKSLVFSDNPEYYYYQLIAFRDQLESEGNGSTFKELSTDSLKNFFLIEPPKEEKKKISTYLDRKTTQIDSLVGKISTQLEKLRYYRQSLISEVVTGKVKVV